MAAMTMLCGEIILPAGLPAFPPEAIRISDNPSFWAVSFWRLPKSALDEVFDPVRKTPMVPNTGDSTG